MRPSIFDMPGSKSNKNRLTAVLFFAVGIGLLALTVGASRKSQDIRERAQVVLPPLEIEDTESPVKPKDVTALFNAPSNDITFDWRWDRDLPENGGVGYCQRCTENNYNLDQGNACFNSRLVMGYKSSFPLYSCDPVSYGPFWWQIVDETERTDGHGTIVLFHYSSNNKSAVLETYPPGGVRYTYSCANRPGHILRVDVAARDANGNITLNASGVPSDITSAETECVVPNTLTPTMSPVPTGSVVLDLEAPKPPINVTGVYSASGTGSVTFNWRWDADLPLNGGVGYCQRCTENDYNLAQGNACYNNRLVSGYKSNYPMLNCEPVTYGPFWWHIVDENVGTAPRTPIVYYYNGQNKSAELADYPPGGVTYTVACGASRPDHTLRIDVATRDANGNMEVNAQGVPSNVVSVKASCSTNQPTPNTTVSPAPTNSPTPTTPPNLPNPVVGTYDCVTTTDNRMICGWVFNDVDGDGIQDSTETTGVSGVAINIRSQDGVITRNITSVGNSGWFQSSAAESLANGTYTVSFTLPTGYVATTKTTVDVPLSTSDKTIRFGVRQGSIITPTVPVTTTVAPTVTIPVGSCGCTANACTTGCSPFNTVSFACRTSAHCQRVDRNKGDADGQNGVTWVDFDWYRRWVLGDTAIATQFPYVNTDFNGDGQTSPEYDLPIILQTLIP